MHRFKRLIISKALLAVITGVPTIVICQNCGRATPDGRFCEHCGAKLLGTQGPAPAPHSTQTPLPPTPPPTQGSSAIRGFLIIGLIIFGALILIGYLADENNNPFIPPTPVITAVPTMTGGTHVPAETITGSVASGGTYRTTTRLRDPATTSYSIRLAGPKGADLDLYIKRGMDPTPNNYDYHSSGADSNEQVRITNPELGNYNLLVQSVKGGGDFTLYITYQYS